MERISICRLPPSGLREAAFLQRRTTVDYSRTQLECGIGYAQAALGGFATKKEPSAQCRRFGKICTEAPACAVGCLCPPSGGVAPIRAAHRSTHGNNPAKKERSFSVGQSGTHPGAAHPYTPTQPAKAQRTPQAHTRPFARRRARRRLRSASSAACSKAQRLRANCFSRWRRSCLLRNRTRS